MAKSRKENKSRQKIRIYANGQYEDCCSAVTVSEVRRKPWNYPKDLKKIRDQNMDKLRSFKEAFKAR